MDLKWLEDFVSLAETRSFSRSAELRHVTQPAFSRRIQALEAWLGTELIDRSVYPTRLTHAGQVFYEQALILLSQMRETRTLLRGQSGALAATIEFAVPHTLSLTFFPRWLERVEALLAGDRPHDGMPLLRTRLRALNVHDALLSLVEGGCDLVMGYHHPSHPVTLDAARYDMLVLGHEAISPFCAPHPDNPALPRHPLPFGEHAVAPFLAYTPNAYLGRMTAVIIANSPVRLGFDKVYETDMAEGLKAMATAGHGIAFLPHSAVEDEIASGRLVALDVPTPTDTAMQDAGAVPGSLTIVLEVRLYRDRLAAQNGDANQALVSRLWDAVAADHAIQPQAAPAAA
jgi:DNA-binding transcriptional LysR family regulator